MRARPEVRSSTEGICNTGIATGGGWIGKPRQREWHRAGQASGRRTLGRASSSKPAVFLQQGNQVSDSLDVGFAWVELVAELDEIALSLALSSASRSFSLLSCFIRCSCAIFFRSSSFLSCSSSLSSCFIRCSCAIFLYLNSISLRLNSISLSS
jgi:hypothetical protein